GAGPDAAGSSKTYRFGPGLGIQPLANRAAAIDLFPAIAGFRLVYGIAAAKIKHRARGAMFQSGATSSLMPAVERFQLRNQLRNRVTAIAIQHACVVLIEQGVFDTGKTGALAALDHDRIFG